MQVLCFLDVFRLFYYQQERDANNRGPVVLHKFFVQPETCCVIYMFVARPGVRRGCEKLRSPRARDLDITEATWTRVALLLSLISQPPSLIPEDIHLSFIMADPSGAPPKPQDDTSTAILRPKKSCVHAHSMSRAWTYRW